MKIVQSFLTNNPCYKAGRKITVKGLMLHSVGCAQPSAQVFINTFNKPTSTAACVHAFIDGNTGTIYQTLPWNHRGWHGGSGKNGSCNDTHIGVEMCEPSGIKYAGGATFTGLPNGKYIDAVTGDVKNVTGGTLTVSSLGQANMRVYVCCASGFQGISGKIGSGSNYLK